jgi:DNA replication and repair protein RecF
VRGFRNLADADLELPEAGCVIVGRNGHGKTSLIEAMLYPQVFRSFRGANDRELVRFGEDGFRVEAITATARVAAGYDARTKQKKVTVDGIVPTRLSDAIGIARGVVLSPLDVALVSGGPRERRRYLDVLLSLTVKGYVQALAHYRRALLHRSRATPGGMGAFEDVAAEHGAVIIAARRAWAGRWAAPWAEHCAAIGETGQALMSYAPRTDGGAEALRAALAEGRERDRAQGRTGSGPHRDELRLTLDGRPLRAYGSAGQQRTAALALRLVECQAMEESGGTLLCLDDAFAELDAERSRRLGQLIESRAGRGNRIVAAVPKEADIPDVIASLPRWSVEAGRVSR